MTHGTAAPISYTVVNKLTSDPIANDQANHTLAVITDGVASPFTGTITYQGYGEYGVTIPGAQVGVQTTTLTGVSSTANVRIIPKSFASDPTPVNMTTNDYAGTVSDTL